MKKHTLQIEVDDAVWKQLKLAKLASQKGSVEEAASHIIERMMDDYIEMLEQSGIDEASAKHKEKTSSPNPSAYMTKKASAFPEWGKMPKISKEDIAGLEAMRVMRDDVLNMTTRHATNWFKYASGFQVESDGDKKIARKIDAARKRFEVFFEDFHKVVERLNMAHKTHGIDEDELARWRAELGVICDHLEEHQDHFLGDPQTANGFIGACIELLDKAKKKIRFENLTKEELKQQRLAPSGDESERRFAQRLTAARMFVTSIEDHGKNTHLDALMADTKSMDGAVKVLSHVYNQFHLNPSPEMAQTAIDVLGILNPMVQDKLKGAHAPGQWVHITNEVRGSAQGYLELVKREQEKFEEHWEHNTIERHGLEESDSKDSDWSSFYAELSRLDEERESVKQLTERAARRFGTSLTLLQHLAVVVKEGAGADGLKDMPTEIRDNSMINGKAPTVSSLSNIYKTFGRMPKDIEAGFREIMAKTYEGKKPAHEDDADYQQGFFFEYRPGDGGTPGKVKISGVFNEVPLEFFEQKYFHWMLTSMRDFFWTGRFETEKDYRNVCWQASATSKELKAFHLSHYVAIDELFLEKFPDSKALEQLTGIIDAMDPKPLWCAASDEDFIGNNTFIHNQFGLERPNGLTCIRVLRQVDQESPFKVTGRDNVWEVTGERVLECGYDILNNETGLNEDRRLELVEDEENAAHEKRMIEAAQAFDELGRPGADEDEL